MKDGCEVSITYDLATLTVSEVLGCHLRSRFPRARYPIRTWIASLLFLELSLAFLGLIAGMATWPRFQPETVSISFAILGLAMPALTISRVQRQAGRLRKQGRCTTRLSPEGIVRQGSNRELLIRWPVYRRISVLGEDVLIITDDEVLWLPRRAFHTPEAVDSFLSAASQFHAHSMNEQSDLIKQ